ncbi:MAG: ATP-binding cassette domain-containing protein [Alphaproteobacteria bacterium]|nr:MAG: ATP-binding cassette domain-containing protein [Alphaproteobacteria bacterium]
MPKGDSSDALRFERVGMRYHLGPEVLTDASFALGRGEFAFLTGPSGAGKSTLLQIASLLIRPSRGRVWVLGEETTGLARPARARLRRRIGVIYQDFRLLDHLTVAENVALPLRLAGHLDEALVAEYVQELLSWVGLADRLTAYPPTLSGGEKQRVAIARAVVAKPAIIIADEPTGSVDPEMAVRILHLLVELNRLGTTVIVATHDRDLVAEIGGRVFALSRGRLAEPEPPMPVRNPLTGALAFPAGRQPAAAAEEAGP